MMKFDVILLLGGSGVRSGLDYNKVLYKINSKPLYYYPLVKFLAFDNLEKIIIVIRREDEKIIKDFIFENFSDDRICFAFGGESRGESVYNGLLLTISENVLIHDGARPIVNISNVEKILDCLRYSKSVTLVSRISDSVRVLTPNASKAVDRMRFILVKTPQGIKRDLLISSYEKARLLDKSFSDDVSLVEAMSGVTPLMHDENCINIKVTEGRDLDLVKGILSVNDNYLIGQSKDTHRLVSGDYITLGGVKIDCPFKALAHSDGDCLYHAIVEAIIGALGKGDIGTHFPDTDPLYKNCDSSLFMKEALKMLKDNSFEIVNLDSTIYIEKPMMRPYILNMVKNISKLLETDDFRINVKATRGEGVGDVGESRAVVCEAYILLRKK